MCNPFVDSFNLLIRRMNGVGVASILDIYLALNLNPIVNPEGGYNTLDILAMNFHLLILCLVEGQGLNL